MIVNPVQFAVVREDPCIELRLIQQFKTEKVLLIASGGCTALTIWANFSNDVHCTLLDPNKAQLSLVQDKVSTLQLNKERNQKFNIGDANPSGLNACGNFEALFACLREFLTNYVAPVDFFHSLFRGKAIANLEQLKNNKFWPVAFELFFNETFLNTLFGPQATQHAKPHSYPSYFQCLLEEGLADPKAKKNYFLHHVFLGCYYEEPSSQPLYLQKTSFKGDPPFSYVEGKLDSIPHLKEYGLIGLSNIFDWMDAKTIAEHAKRLKEETSPGTVILYRQLNNSRNLRQYFEPEFQFDSQLCEQLLAEDKSLFYEKVEVGVRAT